MKKVYKSPFVLDVMNQPGIQKSLERLADLLNKIQKALGEYLERERASFPRFYFVGDEDLLEIIGNSKDILRIMKHLKKMFAGISTIILDDELTQILGLASREGEEVRFKEPVSLKDYPKINDWLTKLESEMRRSLAVLLCESVTELQGFYGSGLEMGSFMAWMEKYPAQLVTLAVQVAWTGAVEASFQQGNTPEDPLNTIHRGLELLADVVLTELAPVTRRKCEHLITELVHQRDVTRTLVQRGISDNTAFAWLYQMRFYLDAGAANQLDCLSIRVSDTLFPYGWEYLGVPDRLVQTPLTDRCYLTLTQALDTQLGGAPFGPAGTGECFDRNMLHGHSCGVNQEKPSLSRHSACNSEDSFSSSVAMRRSISRPWVAFSSVYVKSVHGDASMSSIVWKNAFSVLFRNKFNPSSKGWLQL